jgi:hypothetical protein
MLNGHLSLEHRNIMAKTLEWLIAPSLIGLLAGIAHGVIAHQANLPLGLTEQVQQLFMNDRDRAAIR